ncbi:protein of unknown function [Pseudomonas sp. JV551A1]|uniref:Uncharacterized protein n=1 Tax=Pseudomonas inefficax TaxID=2078786 RepID=A0AAQ1SRE2_9PSED|nr:protein of unknown function [Pseudomonas sp. JV551A1]SPO58514.1 protein of unknown function [Pseudomonas inefficax]
MPGLLNYADCCTGLFAGTPAPTGIAQALKVVWYLWERARPRRGQHRQSFICSVFQINGSHAKLATAAQNN